MFRTLCLALALTASASAQKAEPKPPRYASPQAVLDAMTAATARGDHLALAACFTTRYLDHTAFVHADTYAGARQAILFIGNPDEIKADAQKKKAVYDVLDKHGVTPKAYEAAKKLDAPRREAAVVALIRDRAAFFAEIVPAAAKLGEPRPDKIETKLTGPKIDGDRATATLAATAHLKGKDKAGAKTVERTEPVAFQKIDGGWRYDSTPEGK